MFEHHDGDGQGEGAFFASDEWLSLLTDYDDEGAQKMAIDYGKDLLDDYPEVRDLKL